MIDRKYRGVSLARGEGFPRTNRVVKGADFQRVFNGKSRRLGGGGLLLLIKENSFCHPRLGLAISKKHLKRAVDRNRVKRQVREQFRRSSGGVSGVDIIVMTRNGIGKQNSRQLHSALVRLWEKIA